MGKHKDPDGGGRGEDMATKKENKCDVFKPCRVCGGQPVQGVATLLVFGKVYTLSCCWGGVDSTSALEVWRKWDAANPERTGGRITGFKVDGTDTGRFKGPLIADEIDDVKGGL